MHSASAGVWALARELNYSLNPKPEVQGSFEGLRPQTLLGGAGDLVSKVISRVIIGTTPFRVLITLLIT